jgi:hypothetical protein
MHRAATGPDAAGQLEHVVLGGRGQHWAGIVQDHPGQRAGLPAARRTEYEDDWGVRNASGLSSFPQASTVISSRVAGTGVREQPQSLPSARPGLPIFAFGAKPGLVRMIESCS